MVAYVIYGMVNFWSAGFVLPQTFYAKIDSLCAAFLWRNHTSSASGARVAWKDVCKPKAEGGLGLRPLEEFGTVFTLKRVWIFFSSSGSLWVDWLKNHVFHREGFWSLSYYPRLSPTVRSMLQLHHVVSEFMRCEVGTGGTASFWFDHWIRLGPLIQFTGQNAPRSLRIMKNAKVIETTRNGEWLMPAARSQELQSIQIELTTISAPIVGNEPDKFLWLKSDGTYGNLFSSKVTWLHLRDPSPTVYWARAIWFKENIPRHTFTTWLALLQRLPTRDRLRRWGLSVPEACILCSSGLETHHHLFFECEYSSALWQPCASTVWPLPPTYIHSAASWILRPQQASNSSSAVIVKLVFQSSVYLIWKERNARIFTATSTPPQVLQKALDRLIRDRLLSFPASTPSSPSMLELYFSFCPP